MIQIHQSMYRPKMNAALVAFLFAVFSLEGFTLESDKTKDTTIDANKMTYDERANVNVFEGKVLLTRGSLVIAGSKLVLTQGEDGSQSAVVTGNPARFQQQRDPATPDILLVKGQANKIVFNGQTNVVTLTGEADIKKTTNDEVTEQITGKEIIYEQNTEFLSVSGSKEGEASSRVQAIIKPAK